jgi:hypothetical protein
MPQLTISSSSGSFMNGISPDTNYGASSLVSMGVLVLGGSKAQLNRAIGNFDLSGLPANAFVQAAKMRRTLTLVDPTGHACWIHRCKRPTQWTENGVTWNKYDGVNAWTNAGGDYDTSTPAPLSYNEPLVAGTHEIFGLTPFVLDAIALRGGVVSVVMKNDVEAPSASQRSIWQAGAPWQLVIDYVALALGDPEPPSFGSRSPRAPQRALSPRRPAAPDKPWR